MKTNRLVDNKKIEFYADALATALHDNGGKDDLVTAREQLRFIIRYMRTKPEFIAAVHDDSYAGDVKNGLIHNVFADFNPILLDVVGVMAERNDIDLISRVYRRFVEILSEKYDLVTVDVQTYVELNDDLRDLIKNKVKNELGKNAVLNERINKNMLGGIIMSVQGKRIDASVRAQLDRARIVLKKNNMAVKARD